MPADQRGNGRPKVLRGVLHRGNTVLERLGARTRETTRWQRRLQRVLPDELHGQWRLAGLDRDALALVAHSPIWATQLRYRQGELLEAAASLIDQRPRTCRITVEPPRLRTRRAPPRRLSGTNARLLETTAEGCDDPRLADALRRLASHGRGGD
ncbi:hypothetical protein KBTX_02007 [wastewater metagenome]|uniref:DUF721 domain-containing protein n=2 Tax=unclassified sequences TaxID=12908 RepID=A0A5B8RC63_9ZZZZ|nr:MULTISPECIES: DciA family protein [Arhodomonas]MCS4503821.1 DciA family protein [Arhodomonas aquaeolei]QEA05683.1 hypothetical protein KBTEX_02007 [uncultured organism]